MTLYVFNTITGNIHDIVGDTLFIQDELYGTIVGTVSGIKHMLIVKFDDEQLWLVQDYIDTKQLTRYINPANQWDEWSLYDRALKIAKSQHGYFGDGNQQMQTIMEELSN